MNERPLSDRFVWKPDDVEVLERPDENQEKSSDADLARGRPSGADQAVAEE